MNDDREPTFSNSFVNNFDDDDCDQNCKNNTRRMPLKKCTENYNIDMDDHHVCNSSDIDSDEVNYENTNSTQREPDLTKQREGENLFSDISCYCLPTCASSPSSFLSRTCLWILANSDQFISSLLVSVNMLPEAISYGLIAGLKPREALQSCWIGNIIISVVGGRPGMVFGASGLMAMVLSRLELVEGIFRQNDIGDNDDVFSGVIFIPYAIAFAGILQILSCIFGLGRWASDFPASVVVGMVNGTAFLSLVLQFRYAKDYSHNDTETLSEEAGISNSSLIQFEWKVAFFQYFGERVNWITPSLDLALYISQVIMSLFINTFLSRLNTFFPPSLASVLMVALVEHGIARPFGVQTPLISDYGSAQILNPFETIFTRENITKLPSLTSLNTWKVISVYGVTLFGTSLTETAIALNVVDRLDESRGQGSLVMISHGMANIISALLGGIGGSGLVTSSVLADRTFGTTCLSTFMTGTCVLLIGKWGYAVIDHTPLSAISGTSIYMICSIIQWKPLLSVFTLCLPSSKRDQLPQHYNIARYDLIIMVFVTSAILLLDIATFCIFFVALITSALYSVFSRCSPDDCSEDTESDVHDDSSNFSEGVHTHFKGQEDYGERQKSNDNEVESTNPHPEQRKSLSREAIMNGIDRVSSDSHRSRKKEKNRKMWSIAQAAEDVIFPVSS